MRIPIPVSKVSHYFSHRATIPALCSPELPLPLIGLYHIAKLHSLLISTWDSIQLPLSPTIAAIAQTANSSAEGNRIELSPIHHRGASFRNSLTPRVPTLCTRISGGWGERRSRPVTSLTPIVLLSRQSLVPLGSLSIFLSSPWISISQIFVKLFFLYLNWFGIFGYPTRSKLWILFTRIAKR